MKIDESQKKLVISGPDGAEVTKNAKILVDSRSAEIFVFSGLDLVKMIKNDHF